ncbi:hypothetical protein L1987_31163 [Smallanthus sonchifolius]|uniref:Uncharacterized protein n=1 Tax=Smallanthus sonchifolius TaxID=185202 RepID=A0ACB9I6L9_9ASTR|nr:hypothetical protein L1987_31163 [Smallanthus sonchifolius]
MNVTTEALYGNDFEDGLPSLPPPNVGDVDFAFPYAMSVYHLNKGYRVAMESQRWLIDGYWSIRLVNFAVEMTPTIDEPNLWRCLFIRVGSSIVGVISTVNFNKSAGGYQKMISGLKDYFLGSCH